MAELDPQAVDRNHWSNHVDLDDPEALSRGQVCYPLSHYHNTGGQLLADQQGVPLRTAKSSDQFHQRGHHVQHAHGRKRAALAQDGSHLSGAMIALMPTEEDAKRLAIRGGEKSDDLHVTLFYLGKGDVFGHEDRNNIIDAVRSYVSEIPGPITAKIFGSAHWNGNGDEPSWVWSVGDAPEGDVELNLMHTIAAMALESLHDHPELPSQHTPWVPHICAAYTDDLSLLNVMEQRLGPVEFDRVRVTFAGDATDIPLGEAVTASALLRRKPRDFEVSVDFEAFQEQWEDAVEKTMGDFDKIMTKWRSSIRDQVETALEKDLPETLTGLTLSTIDARVLVERQMIALAQEAGERAQKEAEDQGVEVPEWDIGSLTAALAGRDLLKSVAKMTADALAGGVITSAKRRVTQLLGLNRSPAQAAQDVDDHLTEMSDAGPRAALGTAMTTAQNTGRRAVLEAAPEATYYASEILDKNTCGPCRKIDGDTFATLGVAIKEYPVSGYRDCVGSKYGNNCRGMIVARWPQQVSVGSATHPAATINEINSPEEAIMTETLGGKPNQGTKKDKRLKENDYAKEMDCPDGEDCEEVDMSVQVPKTLADAVEEALAAKRASNGDVTMEFGEEPTAWRGPIVVEGKVTGDGREFSKGALTWQDPPIPLRWNKEDSHGGEPHTTTVNVGKITRLWRDNDLIMGEGEFDLSTDDGRTAYNKVKGEYLKGISIDADSIMDADVEYVWPDTGSEENEEADLFELLFAQPEKIIFNGGRIRAATLCDIPAFAEAYIEIVDNEGAVVAGGKRYPELVPKHASLPVRRIDGLTAGGPIDENWLPPTGWFKNPELSMATNIQVTDDGRVYGHAALWGSCHIGQTDVCVSPPEEDQHSYFMTGEVQTREGKRAAVGQITVGTGHAPLSMGAVPATEHYDHTGHAVADVAVGNDAHGIWVAGAIRPGADPNMVHALRAAGAVSGDWRRIGTKLRLVGLLAVNVPGFSIPKMQARVASGVQEALVAAGRPVTVHMISERERIQQAFQIVMDMMSDKIHEGR